jgi:CBS domain-containing protein
MEAKDIMTAPVVSVEENDSVLHAARLMLQKKMSGLPVVDSAGRLVGIVTEGDFLRRAETGTQRRRPRWIEFLVGPGRLAEEYVHASGRKVNEIMTTDVHTVAGNTPLAEVVRLMERRRIKRVPVVDDGKLVGIVTRANLLRAFASVAPEIGPAAPGDGAIRERLLAQLNEQPWAPRAQIDVLVRNGVVELHGAILDERQRQALIVAAENVPGVKKVVDHLVWVDPMSGMLAYAPGEEAKAS